MWRLSPNPSGRRRARNAVLAAALLLLGGCGIYRFTGGGLPQHVRRVYIEPFDNQTAYQALTADLLRQLQEQFPGSLGVRLSSQQNADAIVRGKLLSVEEQTTNFSPNPDPNGRIERLEARVQITFEAEIYDVRNDAVLWRGAGITAIGNYRDDVDEGRRKALEQVVQKMIEGAQSQW